MSERTLAGAATSRQTSGVWEMLRAVWRLQPTWLRTSVRAASKGSGLPHFFWYMARFQESHSAANYAGNLAELKRDYALCNDDSRAVINKRFERILDCLVLDNGVTKTTYTGRHRELLERIFNDPRASLNRESVSVLDVPSSAGMSSLDAYRLLTKRFIVERYVLGDRFFNLYVDEKRGCVFDEERHLIQVRTCQGYVSVNRPSVMGNEQNCLVRFLMFPRDRRAREFQRRFPWDEAQTYTIVRMLHPEVEQAVFDGRLQMRTFDVFASPDDRYDIILSFNLLQKNYFPVSQIRQGIESLGRCLNEGGLLILGDTSRFTVYRKSKEGLAAVWQES